MNQKPSEKEQTISIGIDLGTTNSVLSFTAPKIPDTKPGELPSIEVFPVPQLVALGEVAERKNLPSFIYFPQEAEKSSGELRLPWDPFGERIVGEYARKRGAETQGRLVSSAKSWLSFDGVDRSKPILPVDAAEDCQKISPIVASAVFLRHLKSAWNHQNGKKFGELKGLEVVLTIPASFDAVAREYTVQAAKSAGLESVTLLEEPQAAFYAWLYANRENWSEVISTGETCLIVDIGGGTTDFSLIEVQGEDKGIELKRLAVGRHLLLGGDNMDLALTEVLIQQLNPRDQGAIRRRIATFVQNVRASKETILSSHGKDEVTVTLPGMGKGLIGGSIRAKLSRQTVEETILEGFFPMCALDDEPMDAMASGLTEFTLPYERDSAITRHLAAFLKKHADHLPTHLLFNGGVLRSRPIRSRIEEAVNAWLKSFGKGPVKVLEPVDLDLSVAIGAAAFSLARTGELWRIRGGITRSYYIGIERSGPAIPGVKPRLMALCLVAEGAEEGAEFQLGQREFGLIVGKKVRFPFLTSSSHSEHTPGEIIEEIGDTFQHISSIETTIEAPGLEPGTVIPVRIKTRVTEIGTLEIFLVSEEKGLSFKMEFGVRD